MRKEELSGLILLFVLLLPAALRAEANLPTVSPVLLTKIPKRAQDAATGSQFAAATSGMSGFERQQDAVKELLQGNMPDFIKKMIPVQLSYQPPKGERIEALIWVTPDYVAIGSDEDFLRMPLTYPSAVAVAQAFDCILPTRKMVDAIYAQATCHLSPDPLPPGSNMRSSEYYLKHRQKIRDKRKQAGCVLGELVAGHKKDVVLTNRLNKKTGRIAIYGWQRKNGQPIQPLSTVHGERYADYSHGIRLVYQTVWINGKARSILDVIQDPQIAPVLTYEGSIKKPRKMLRFTPQ